MKNRAFTLVELLVVVLIIGILAAIAVPQYQIAVEKSRAGQVMSLVRSLANAQEAFFLSNLRYAYTFEELDLTLPPTSKECVYAASTGHVCHSLDNGWEIVMYGSGNENTFSVQGRYKDLIQITNYLYNGRNLSSTDVNFIRNNAGELTCEAVGNKDEGRRLCEALGGKEVPSETYKGYYRL